MKASDICGFAAALVSGDREATHGPKLRNHANIATLWNAYLAIRRDPAAGLSALDAAHMMVLLKVARTQLGGLNPDDHVDMAGYAGVAGEIAAALAPRRPAAGCFVPVSPEARFVDHGPFFDGD